MAERSYCTLKSSDFDDPSYMDRALSQLVNAQAINFNVEEAQLYAWEQELEILKSVAQQCPDCTIALEYMIPRMGKRIDAVLLTGAYIFLLEFKVGERSYPSAAIDQVTDYAFDLRNFHKESHERVLFPVLVCTEASYSDTPVSEESDGIYAVQMVNSKELAGAIRRTKSMVQLESNLDHAAWLNSLYSPTPTIVEAAQALYQSNEVEDISRHEAGLTNIEATTKCVEEIIEYSKQNNRKSICFITGVPGAGKTLIGLNLASKRRKTKESEASQEFAVFLSGNGPLIEVLQASLTEDQISRNQEQCRLCKSVEGNRDCKGCPYKKSRSEIKAEVKSFVQGVHLFREELFTTEDAPPEHVAIFDEAQRAWTSAWLEYKMKTRRHNQINVSKSEPHCLIEYMDRHRDWATMVCLVGGGQEINSGEAGIIEWFTALHDYFPDWDVYASEELSSDVYLGDIDVINLTPNLVNKKDLHLSVDMRSFRNKNVAAFAEALIGNKPQEARKLYSKISDDYPIVMTRNINVAKEWVRDITRRPSDRYGVIADSFGLRIRADGITVPTTDFDTVTWFLRGKDNVDSSYFMEIAASEFKIQGLEIDYAVVAWEGDFRYKDGHFSHYRFRGGKWQRVSSDMNQRYLTNGYRVLLTRSRQGYVIYIPAGSVHDPTRKPEFYDDTYNYLKSIGIRELA